MALAKQKIFSLQGRLDESVERKRVEEAEGLYASCTEEIVALSSEVRCTFNGRMGCPRGRLETGAD